jgi:putative two-component system response regulator
MAAEPAAPLLSSGHGMDAIQSATLLPVRPRALCVDDEPLVLRLVERLLRGLGFDVDAVADPVDALTAFRGGRYDLVLTDVRMPGMDGHQLITALRDLDAEVPIVVVTGQGTLENATSALREGATGMIVKPFTTEEFRSEVEATLERHRYRHDALQLRFVTPILDGVALALTAAIEARDLETGEHCRQLGVLGEGVARLMGLSDQERTTIRIGGYLHDIGKIGIADRILLKPGPLTDEEYREMQRHAELGATIVSTHEQMAGIADIVRHHHERFDGRGYPAGLAGDYIPIGARIIAVADSWSAMTNDRVYRKARSETEALEELRRNRGTQFDPVVVDLFERVIQAGVGRGVPAVAPPATPAAAG